MKKGFRNLAWLWMIVSVIIALSIGITAQFYGNAADVALWVVPIMWTLWGALPSGAIFCFTGFRYNE